MVGEKISLLVLFSCLLDLRTYFRAVTGIHSSSVFFSSFGIMVGSNLTDFTVLVRTLVLFLIAGTIATVPFSSLMIISKNL